ncbi:DUF3152 domain-containing protein [Streptomyces polyrhachis]|uniref:DUF3152 domain-containing protein n=1 Tax=Streptomyces polyrhachis TaxID=1282885 RepID=A0ABW2GCC6_9ACTN
MPRAVRPLTGLLLGLGCIAGGVSWWDADTADRAAPVAQEEPAPVRTTPPPVRPKPAPTPSRTPRAAPSASTPAPAGPTAVPRRGSGRYTTAPGSGQTTGKGSILRYLVQVEDGSGLRADAVGAAVERVLADPRGWTADGRHGFRRVASGPYDVVIKLATPERANDLCRAGGLHPQGDVNCRVGATVVVNLTRWTEGSAQFTGPITEYRALIVNHEVGHSLGHGHLTCPGPGKPAPAMMQQIRGLKGCVANAWPYDRGGRYLSGPSVP